MTGSSNQAVTWNVSPAGVGAISASGMYTAPATIAAQSTVTITATSGADTTKSASATVTLTAPATSPASNCPAPGSNTFTGCYYSDMAFGASGGTLAFSRVDPQINFNWGTSGPGGGMGAYNFSVRWKGNFTFAAGTYTFNLSTDDGSILYIDGQSIINEWSDHPPTLMTQTVTLTAGPHLIDVDYYQDGGGAAASLSWTNVTPAPTPVAVSITPASGSLAAAATLQFSSTVTGSTNQAVTWSIAPAGLGSISASGLYTAPATVTTAQTATVTATSAANATKSASATVTLTPTVTAPANACPAASTNAFTGCYYTDKNFGNSGGALGFSRVDQQINFNWTNGPGSGVAANNFSVRWQGSFTFAAGSYVFSLSTDDGSILYIDGQQVINDWSDHAAYVINQSVTLTAGTHLIELDYYQAGGGASASLTWANPAVSISMLTGNQTLNAGQTAQFNTSVSGATNQAVTWTLSPAAFGAISSSGLYTAPALISTQTNVTVLATSQADSTKTASATVNLQPSSSSSAPSLASCAAPASNVFTGCYYTDINFGATGGLGFSRPDSQINFDWGTNGPGSGVGAYNFSVRWQGNFTFLGGAYTFTISTDDGSVLYIDGHAIMNEWGGHPAYSTTQSVNLTPGSHLIEFNYFQAGGGASAALKWTPNQ